MDDRTSTCALNPSSSYHLCQKTLKIPCFAMHAGSVFRYNTSIPRVNLRFDYVIYSKSLVINYYITNHHTLLGKMISIRYIEKWTKLVWLLQFLLLLLLLLIYVAKHELVKSVITALDKSVGRSVRQMLLLLHHDTPGMFYSTEIKKTNI